MVRALIAAVAFASGASCTPRVVNAFPDNFVGVGVELTMQEHAPIVVRTLRGGPAEQAGLEANDKLMEIDHAPIRGLELADVVVRLRGKEGTPVEVTIQRGKVAIETELVRHSMAKAGGDYTARE